MHAPPGTQVSRPRAEIEEASAAAAQPEKHPKTAAAVPVVGSSVGGGAEGGDGEQPGLVFRMM